MAAQEDINKIINEIEELEGKIDATDAATSAASSEVEAPEGIAAAHHPEEAEPHKVPAALSVAAAIEELENYQEIEAPPGSEAEEVEPDVEAIRHHDPSPVAESPSNTSDGTLSMKLTGNMTLRLQYECFGQEISVSFSGQVFHVQLSDGTEFKIPVARRHLHRVA